MDVTAPEHLFYDLCFINLTQSHEHAPEAEFGMLAHVRRIGQKGRTERQSATPRNSSDATAFPDETASHKVGLLAY